MPRSAQSLDSPAEVSATTLTALVVGTDDWAIEQSANALSGAGHTVHRCHAPGEPAFPCYALRPGGRCPVSMGIDVAVVVRARPTADPEVGEIGATCALRDGVPLVAAGISRHSPFTGLAATTVGERGDLVSAVVDAVEEHRAVIEIPEQPS